MITEKKTLIGRKRLAVVLSIAAIAWIAPIDMPFSYWSSRPRAATRPVVGAGTQSIGPSSSSGPTLTYNPGSSAKVQQIIGDCDWVVKAANGTCQPTASQTITRANVAGNGEGYSFEQPATGKLIFLFGDTIANNPSAQYPAAPCSPTSNYPFEDYNGRDPLAASTSTDPEGKLVLDFFLSTPPGATPPKPIFVNPVFPD